MTNVRSNGNGFTFNIVGFSDTSIPPAVKNITYEVFMDAIIINFESSKPFDGEAVVRWKKNRGTEQEPSESTSDQDLDLGSIADTLSSFRKK